MNRDDHSRTVEAVADVAKTHGASPKRCLAKRARARALKRFLLVAALMIGLGMVPAGRAAAQTFTTLHSFVGYPNDGAYPYAGLTLSSNMLYGTTRDGGVGPGGGSGYGTVFAVNTDGTGFTNLHSFRGTAEGANPYGGLVLSGNTLYGTVSMVPNASEGGAAYAVSTDGTSFTTLYGFTNGSEAWGPYAGVILSSNKLYGTTYWGGDSWGGTVYAVSVDGTAITNLHSFAGGSYGAYPWAGVISSGGTLYGTTAGALITNGYGTVFKVNTDGTGFMTLHSFTATSGGLSYDFGLGTNSDGANPYGGLVLSGSTLYGTAAAGGSFGNGTVYAVNTDSTGFTNLYSFTGGNDGAHPYAGLVLSGNTLYGTATAGGLSGNGTLFKVNTDGTSFTSLYSFDGGSDGADPRASLVLAGNALYGTATAGGNSNHGTVFSFTLPLPPLAIIRSGANVILTWPTNAIGFTLQSTTNLVSPVIWATVSPGPVVVNDQNTVTNPVTGTGQFYRLSQ